MKKAVYFFLIFLSVFLICTLAASAEFIESSGAQDVYNSLSGETRELMERFGVSGADASDIFDVSFGSIMNAVISVVKDNVKAPLMFFFKLLGMLVLISVVKSMSGEGNENLEMFCVLLCAAVSVKEISECINALLSACDLCGKFLLAYVPVFAVIVSVSGSAATALTYNSAVLTAAQLISAASTKLFMPLCGILMSLGISFSLNETVSAQRLTGAINKAITFFVGICSSFFAALLTLRGVMSAGADSMATRGVRMALSSFIPVVGGAISEAYSSVLGSLSIIKGSVAVFGIAAVFALNLPVLIQAGLYGLSLSAASFFADSFSQSGMSGVLRCIGCAVKLMSALAAMEIFLIVISTGILLVMKGST